MIILLQVLFAVLLASSAHCADDDDYEYVDNHSGGFGEMYEWQPSVRDAIREGNETGLPVMLLIHKVWCKDASKLKDSFLASNKIQELSKKFIMVNTTDDKEVEGKEFTPDGKYYPRIFFIKDGKVLNDISNDYVENPRQKYFYKSEVRVLRAMKKALRKTRATKRN